MGALHGEGIDAAAEADQQVLDRSVADRAAHAETGEGGGGEAAAAIGAVAGVVDVEVIAAAAGHISFDREIGPDSLHVAAAVGAAVG